MINELEYRSTTLRVDRCFTLLLCCIEESCGVADINFDSTVDDMRQPQIFKTYNDAQAYPEYLVQFQQ